QGAAPGHMTWFTKTFANGGEVTFAARASATSLQYRLTLASQASDFGDAGPIVRTFTEKDNGTIDLSLPAKSGGSAGASFKEIMTESQYNALFPNRFGHGKTGEASDGKFDFY